MKSVSRTSSQLLLAMLVPVLMSQPLQADDATSQSATQNPVDTKDADLKAAQVAGKDEQDAIQKKIPAARLIKVSKETTRLTEPLRKDGMVDYIRALDEACAKGVTPQNNALIDIWKTLGPSEISSDIREDYFKKLGIKPVPAEGNYVRPLSELDDELIKRLGDKYERNFIFDQYSDSQSQPWSKADSPHLASWIEANNSHIDRLQAASRMQGFYSPLLTSDEYDLLIGVLILELSPMREAAHMLASRAMYRLAQGKIDEAQADLFAVHRLARMADRNPTLIGYLVAAAIDSIAFQGDTALLHHGKLTKKQALAFAKQVDALPPLKPVADTIDTSERYMFLDSVAYLAKHGPEAIQMIQGLAAEEENTIRKTLSRFAVNSMIDWNTVMRIGNERYDTLVTAMRKEDRKEREKRLDQFERALIASKQNLINPLSMAALLLKQSPRQAASKRMAEILCALLMPSLRAVCHVEGRVEMQNRFTFVAAHLAAYRAEQGEYPRQLESLKLEVERLRDIYADGSIRYESDGKNFTLYSVGKNGNDERGKPRHTEGDEDDITMTTLKTTWKKTDE